MTLRSPEQGLGAWAHRGGHRSNSRFLYSAEQNEENGEQEADNEVDEEEEEGGEEEEEEEEGDGE